MDLLWRTGKLISYIFESKNRHGLHPPFTYSLYDKVIAVKHPLQETTEIETLRRQLLHDTRKIEITDFGAGQGTYQKALCDLTKNSAKSKRYAELLFRLTKHFNPSTILELGTCVGLTTAYLQKACPQARVISLEGSPGTAKIARENFEKLSLQKTQLVEGPFDNTLAEVLKKVSSLDLVYFDGNHREEPTWNYFSQCLPYINETSVFIFDDIYWSKEMHRVWERIKAHPQVTLSIDLFQLGLVFFRPMHQKEHFTLWY